MKKHLILAALLSLGAPVLPALAQTTPTSAAALPSGYTRTQLEAVTPLLSDLKTLQSSRIDLARGRVVVVGLSAVDRLALIVKLRQAGLPSGVVDYQTAEQAGVGPEIAPVSPAPTSPAPTSPAPRPATPVTSSLPATNPLLATPHRAALSGPATIRAGEAGLWSFTLTNSGAAPLRLAHGACDVRFEVVNAAGQVVRPNPRDTLCTQQLVITDVARGETREVQKVRWEGLDAQNKPLPAGTYTLRAVFSGAGVRSSVATLQVRVQ
ncbi:hypothetical protein [Deinococcus koreensis]|uniref:FlgD Ig-like domain-containing protein n=1 Tax=Deinococcus koreensis TaxID=2054903 RepID=A0A2K3UWW5_9DEIO|nr:hypothetical protein [Deinococcus koreensis]PNY81027.1 hypothetical protein CVO96_06225 [Deinococcus koreensis]